MEKTVIGELILSNGHRINIQTSTRQAKAGKKSTFISINTGCFRIRIVQRNSLSKPMLPNARIAFSRTSETDNLAAIETLALSLKEAIKIAEELNGK